MGFRKYLFSLLFLILAGALSAQAQSTTVSGQVTDAAGQSWNNGTVTANFVSNVQYPTFPQYAWTGGALSPTVSGTLTSTGSYSISIPSSTAITPGGSAWQFQFCPQATAFCFTTANVTITGGTQTVNATPPAIAISMSNPPPNTTAYLDSEIVGAIVGQSYYNLTTNTLRICQALPCSGSNWTNSEGGNTPSAANVLLSSKCSSSKNCFTAHGDARWTGDCVTDGSTANLTSATANFTSADVGRHAWCADTTASHHSLCITGTVQTIVSVTQVTLSNNSTAVCPGTGSNYFMGIGTSDASQWAAAYTASLQSNATVNGVPNALVVDCGTYLVDNNIQFANFNNFKHNITGSTLPWYPKCVTILVADNFNFAGAEAITGTTCVLICNANGQEKSLPPDYAQQSGMGVFRDFSIIGSGLSYPAQAGVIWIQPLNEFTNNQVTSLPGPSSTVSKTIQVNWYQAQVINNQIEPNADSTITNPPTSLDVNATRVTVYNNRFFGSCGIYVQMEAGFYQDLIDANQLTGLASCTNPFITDLGSLQAIYSRNFCNFNSASSTCIQVASGANVSVFVSQNTCVFTAAATCINNAGQMQVGTNRIYGASGTAYTNSGTLDHTFGQDYYQTFSGYTFTNTGTWLPLISEQGQGACAGSTATITYLWTSARGKGYKNNPTVVISDVTTSGGARISARTTSTATVTCTGATDAFDYTITPNPF